MWVTAPAVTLSKPLVKHAGGSGGGPGRLLWGVRPCAAGDRTKLGRRPVPHSHPWLPQSSSRPAFFSNQPVRWAKAAM